MESRCDSSARCERMIPSKRSAFEQWIGLLQAAFVRAGVPERRAHTLALLVESSLEGLMVIARATRDRAPVLAVADEVAALIEGALLTSSAAAAAR